MIVELATALPCTPQQAWHEAQTTRLFYYVTAPLVRFQPVQPPTFPDVWREGSYRLRMALFGVLPLGQQTIVIVSPVVSGSSASPHYEMYDRGHGQMAKKWHHTITIRAGEEGGTHYGDHIDIEAGLLTPFVALFASILFRYRQKRWRRLARNGFDYSR